VREKHCIMADKFKRTGDVYKICKGWTRYNIVGIRHYWLILHQRVQCPLSAIRFVSSLRSSG